MTPRLEKVSSGPIVAHGWIAQLEEHRPYKARVGGSSPSPPTRILGDVPHGAVVQLVRIPACHAGGRGFESRPLRQQIQGLQAYRGFSVWNAFRAKIPQEDTMEKPKIYDFCFKKGWVHLAK